MTPSLPRLVVPLVVSFSFASAMFGQAASEPAVQPAPATRSVTTSEVDRALAEEIATRFGGDRRKFLIFLRDQGKMLREYRTDLEKRLASSPAPQVEAVATSPEERVHLRLIQMKRKTAETDDQLLERGREVRAKITAATSFADVAKQFSDDVKAVKGGDWGWVTRSDLKPAFGELAFKLQKGETSAPLIVSDSCFILFAEDRR